MKVGGEVELVKKMIDEILGDLANEVSYQKFYYNCILHADCACVHVFQKSC